MSQTGTYELQTHTAAVPNIAAKAPHTAVRRFSEHSTQSQRRHFNLGGSGVSAEGSVGDGGERDATVAVEEEDRWNYPRGNMYRTFATFWAFVVMGMNDAAYGALIPYLETYYNLSYTVVSLIFLSPLFGYNAAAFLNTSIHSHYGQRGVAFLSAAPKVIGYVVICLHPPYPALVVMYLFIGFGNGLEDAAWNSWIGAMPNANEVLGILHGCYGLGATVSPLVATAMVTKAGLEWYRFYYIMIGVATIELLASFTTFYPRTGALYLATHPRTTQKSSNQMYESLFTLPSARVTWLCALFLFGYVGCEVSIGGWVVSFMLRERGGTPFASGMTETGFWLGITVGRVVLGFVTGRLGEKRAIAGYLVASMGFLLLFWLVPNFFVSAVAVALQGFFLGPMFPAAVVVAARLLPKHLHVSAIGFAAAFGGTGGAGIPFAVGAIAQKAGVKVLQPIILAGFVFIEVMWLGLPRLKKRD